MHLIHTCYPTLLIMRYRQDTESTKYCPSAARGPLHLFQSHMDHLDHCRPIRPGNSCQCPMPHLPVIEDVAEHSLAWAAILSWYATGRKSCPALSSRSPHRRTGLGHVSQGLSGGSAMVRAQPTMDGPDLFRDSAIVHCFVLLYTLFPAATARSALHNARAHHGASQYSRQHVSLAVPASMSNRAICRNFVNTRYVLSPLNPIGHLQRMARWRTSLGRCQDTSV